MAFAVEDYFDLLRLLSENPQWQAQLRRSILPDDFQSLPDIVRELAEAQRRAEARLEGAEARLEGVEERLGRLEEAMARLLEAQVRAEEQLVALRADFAKDRGFIEEQLVALRTDFAKDRGVTLEWRYREKAPGYFARMLRRARAVPSAELDEMLEGTLPEEEYLDAILVDLVIRGRLHGRGETPTVLLAVEVSATVDDGDVTRAARRASLLRSAGHSAIPVVAGEGATREGKIEAKVRHVAMLQDGSTELWEDALAAWPPLP